MTKVTPAPCQRLRGGTRRRSPEPLGVAASDGSARRRNTGDAAADDIVGEVALVAAFAAKSTRTRSAPAVRRHESVARSAAGPADVAVARAATTLLRPPRCWRHSAQRRRASASAARRRPCRRVGRRRAAVRWRRRRAAAPRSVLAADGGEREPTATLRTTGDGSGGGGPPASAAAARAVAAAAAAVAAAAEDARARRDYRFDGDGGRHRAR